jgi:DNA helicase-2/ATP-dependent DNA helicase PcrA
MAAPAIRERSPTGELNDAQKSAVEHGLGDHNGPSPLLVVAGAGAGKTNMLAHRVARLILEGADPNRIMLATFSRRAAGELNARVQRLLAKKFSQGAAEAATPAFSGTFHSIGARLLRDYAERLGIEAGFTIHDREDSADLLNLVRHELGFSERKERFPTKGTCLSIYSRTLNARAELAETLGSHFPWCAAHEKDLRGLFAGYVEAKQRQSVLDYDDLLLYFAQMMQVEGIAAEVAGRFDHLLVDEYQDTNRLQHEIVLALRPKGRGLTVVGDDAQAIYSFRAATIRNILDFPGDFDPPARIITLDQNYRSTRAILAASNAVIALSPQRFAKELWTDRAGGARPVLTAVGEEGDQARYVATRVLAAREAGASLRSQAVLFRSSSHSAALELELTRRNIPFVKYGGLKFLDAAHVKDALAMLRFAQNPRDRIAGFRLALTLPGVGPANAERIVAAAGRQDGFAALAEWEAPARAAADFKPFAQVLRDLAGGGQWPGDLGQVVEWLRPHIERRFDDFVTRHADLDALERIGATYPSRERFLAELTLDPPDATSDEAGPPHRDEDYLILSTIHSAKGQEWRSVFLLNAVDGCIPSDLAVGSRDELEEERRLLYVAMTRARDELTLVIPQRFYIHNQRRGGDSHVFASRTRFIPAKLLNFFDQVAWPAAQGARPQAAADGRRVDLTETMRAMWR